MTGAEMAECEVPDKLSMISYVSQIYDVFRGEIPHFKYPKMVRKGYIHCFNFDHHVKISPEMLRNLPLDPLETVAYRSPVRQASQHCLEELLLALIVIILVDYL